MFGRIARRLGFDQSVPVSLIDSWHVPSLTKAPIEIAPRGGAASCRVDQFGRLQVLAEPWSVELTFAGGARWVPASKTERIAQQVVSPGVVETIFQTPAGPVVQRVAAGVVDGEPAAIVEVENTGGVAIAIGLVVRPLGIEGRGFIGEIAADRVSIAVDQRQAVLFSSAPASVKAVAGADGDLLDTLPDAAADSSDAATDCRSGGAQAAAVWPLPHTATLQFVLPLDAMVAAQASVPSTADVQRGWASHLRQGMRVEVDELLVDESLAAATRSALTLWPEPGDEPLAVLALSESGFGRDAGRFFEHLERCEEDERVLRALARWTQLGEQSQQLEDVERILGRVARAAHVVANGGGQIAGEAWLEGALVALGGRLHQIGQPDVAERVQGFGVKVQPRLGRADTLGGLSKQLDKRGAWPDGQMVSSCSYVRAVRATLIEDGDDEVGLFPEVPVPWRGRAVDVFGLPISGGTVSFGLRWHGPRAALLWEASLAPETPFRLTVPGIDPDFVSFDREGEVLLADPRWADGSKGQSRGSQG